VTMGDAQAAAKAISQLNGSTLDGRQIRVDEAQERARGDGGFRGGGGGGGVAPGEAVAAAEAVATGSDLVFLASRHG